MSIVVGANKVFGIIIEVPTNNGTVTYSNMPRLSIRTSGTPVFSISANSQKLDRFVASNGVNYGECNADKYEVELFNLPADLDLAGATIKLVQVGNINNITITSSDKYWFIGTIDSTIWQKNGTYQHIIAYNIMYKLRDTNISPILAYMWTEYSSGGIRRWTLMSFRRYICEALGIEDIGYDGLNGDKSVTPFIVFEKNIWLTTELANPPTTTFSTIMKMICEAQTTFMEIDYSTGTPRINFKEFIDMSSPISSLPDYSNLVAFGNSDLQYITTDSIDGFFVYDTVDHATYIYPDGTNINTCKNPYISVGNNIFGQWIDENDIYGEKVGVKTVAQRIMFATDPFVYTPAEIELLVSRQERLGVFFKVVTKDDPVKEFKCGALGVSYKGSQLSIQTIHSIRRPITTNTTSYGSGNFSSLKAQSINSSEIGTNKIKLSAGDKTASLWVDTYGRLIYTDSAGVDHTIVTP